MALVVAAATLAAGCAGPSTSVEPATSTSTEVTPIDSTTPPSAEAIPADPSGCADVINVVVTPEDSGTYRFDVTVRSPDTGEEKYADLWEVRGPDGTVLGERILTHPHVEEQPFTRSQSGISIPDGVSTVTVVARDTVAGFCGEDFEIDVP
jgi:hypothetical protein